MPSDDARKTETISRTHPTSADASPRVALIFYSAVGAEIAALTPGSPLVVGRAPPAGLRIDDRSLSREHARFVLDDYRVHVEDLGSKNGTLVRGRRVDRAELEIGDEVSLGSVRGRVQALGLSGESLGIDGEHRFRRHLDDELSRAQASGGPFALLLVRAAHVRSASAPARLVFLEAVRRHLRPVDRLAMYGADAAQVLLSGAAIDEAKRVARAITTAPQDQRPFVGVALYPEAGTTVDALVERSLEALRRASASSPIELAAPSASTAPTWVEETIVVGAKMREVFSTVARVASSRIAVVLRGETGTGKEVIARMIHETGARKARRMVCVNCGAIPKDLVESMLFGHERGAFTGALQQQKGVFEEADGGTVFLDEIGELPLPVQAALLRVLETKHFCRVGSAREIAVDARVVAATHRDLEAMAKAGEFREDLYYRLSGVVIEIPPLRERTDEIEPLARRFLRLASESSGLRVEGFTGEAMAILRAYAWPGNVRELRNVIERAVVVARGSLIGPDDLPARVQAALAEPERASDPGRTSDPGRATDRGSQIPSLKGPATDAAPARGRVQQYEAKLLFDTLEANGWNRAEAAAQLKMPVRTLSYRMKVLGIKKPGPP